MKKDIIPGSEAEKKLLETVKHKRESFAERYPLTFALVGTFGFVSTLYGFEKLIDKIDVLANNPWILLAIGLGTLLATGLALRKLG